MNIVSAVKRAGDNCFLDRLVPTMAAMTTVKKVYILLWKNLIIKVWICFHVDFVASCSSIIMVMLKKRHWLMSILEIVIPTVLFIALVILRAEGMSWFSYLSIYSYIITNPISLQGESS